jgi:hypothetical protein
VTKAEQNFRKHLTGLKNAAEEIAPSRSTGYGRRFEADNGTSVLKLLDQLEEALNPLKLVAYRLGDPVFEDNSGALVFQDGNPVPDDEAAAEVANEQYVAPAKEAEAEQDERRAEEFARNEAKKDAQLAEAREAGRRNA